MGAFDYGAWFRTRFDAACAEFEGRTFVMDEIEQAHDEAASMRRARTRYRDTLALIRPELADPGERRLLDVGGGQVAWLTADRFDCVAADLTGVFREESERLGVPTESWDVTQDDGPFEPESFDIVAFTEVLEHLPPPPFPYLRRVVRLLRPGGILLFTVPNLGAFWKRWKFLLFGRSPLKLGARHHERTGYPEHIREYTWREVKRILPASGVTIEKMRSGDYGYGWHRAVTSQLHRVTRAWGRTILVRARK